jgi:hypothetical protein
VRKTARWKKLLVELPPNHNTQQKKTKKGLTMLLCLPGPYAAAAYIFATTTSTSTKLAGSLTNIPINLPTAAICMILIIFNERGDFYTTARFLMMMNLKKSTIDGN